jgi:hypothetical protein
VAELQTLMTSLVFDESPRRYDNRPYCFDISTEEVLAMDLPGNNEASISWPHGESLVARCASNGPG